MTGRRGDAANAGTFRLAALAIATLFVLCGCVAVVLAYKKAFLFDFLSYWAAGRLVVEGHASFAYDIVRHRAVEALAMTNIGFLPFPYPPPFLLVVAPFGLGPSWAALAAWIAITAGLYCAAVRRLMPLRFSLAQAAAAANFITGQNGFLTSAIFIQGTNLLATRPLLAGATLGLLVFKPQLAILLPVALIAGREWRAIAGGILSTLALLAISLALFGIEPYRGFLAILPHYSDWLSAGRWPWGELASPFALLRYCGVPQMPALVIHGLIAVAAIAVTARAWALKLEQRIPMLAAATLLITPYLFTYDGLLLTLPLASLLRRRNGRAAAAAVWICSLLPIVCYFTSFPNTIPLAAVLALGLLYRDSRTRFGPGDERPIRMCNQSSLTAVTAE